MRSENKTPPQKRAFQRTGLYASFLLFSFVCPIAYADPLPPKETGIWFDNSGKGAVEIAPCGSSLCGKIVWLKEPFNAEGKPLVDRFNPNPQRRTSTICGLQVLGGLQFMPEGTWDIGWIYDPKTGKAYDAALSLTAPDQLKVTGYKGVKLFAKSFTWTRAPSDLPRCNAELAASENNGKFVSPSDKKSKLEGKTPTPNRFEQDVETLEAKRNN
ncbi:MAG: DUF2147 domain-containing protein [Hyphomicrobium sp.]